MTTYSISLYALYFIEGETTVEQFEQMTNSAFPYAEIDVNTFFDLIGESPPRVYILNDGEVDAVLDKDIALKIENRYQAIAY